MGEAKHTTGPWAVENLPASERYTGEPWVVAEYEIDGAGGELVATLNPYPPHMTEGISCPGCGGDPAANARLIAAAPEMYAVLVKLANIEDVGDVVACREQAQSLLAKIAGD